MHSLHYCLAHILKSACTNTQLGSNCYAILSAQQTLFGSMKDDCIICSIEHCVIRVIWSANVEFCSRPFRCCCFLVVFILCRFHIVSLASLTRTHTIMKNVAQHILTRDRRCVCVLLLPHPYIIIWCTTLCIQTIEYIVENTPQQYCLMLTK